MPVIKYNEEEKRCRLLSGNIKKRMDAMQITDKQMAACTGMAAGTFNQKKNHPERFTYPELMRLFKKLKFPIEEITEVLM